MADITFTFHPPPFHIVPKGGFKTQKSALIVTFTTSADCTVQFIDSDATNPVFMVASQGLKVGDPDFWIPLTQPPIPGNFCSMSVTTMAGEQVTDDYTITIGNADFEVAEGHHLHGEHHPPK